MPSSRLRHVKEAIALRTKRCAVHRGRLGPAAQKAGAIGRQGGGIAVGLASSYLRNDRRHRVPAVLYVVEPTPLIGNRSQLTELSWKSKAEIGRVVHDRIGAALGDSITEVLPDDSIARIHLDVVELPAPINLQPIDVPADKIDDIPLRSLAVGDNVEIAAQTESLHWIFVV